MVAASGAGSAIIGSESAQRRKAHCDEALKASIIRRFAFAGSAATTESRDRVISPLQSRPIRTVLKWQLIATAAMAVIAGLLAGAHGVASASLGGLVNIVAGIGYALLWGLGVKGTPSSAGLSLVAMFRAEAVKVVLIFGQLWLVLSIYKDIVPVAFFTAFIVTVIIFSMAFFVRD
jgi:ATP synthase protein I